MNWRSRRVFLAGSVAAAGEILLQRNLSGSTLGSAIDEQGANLLIATIDASRIGDPISKYLYGMFLEHAGSLVYRSLWSEMLDDRKFYYPVNSIVEKPAAQPATVFLRSALRKWRPIGPDEFVTMDPNDPYVGDQSVRIKLEKATDHGIQQSGLVLAAGKAYVGRVILAGAPGTQVKVSLFWGEGPG